MKRVIATQQAPKPVGPYSQATEAHNFVFCSGQISIDPQTDEVFTGDIKIQTRRVMANIAALLEQAGLNFSHVVKTTIYLTSMADFAIVNDIYGEFFRTDPPARSTVAVAGLPKGVNVEIEVTAYRPL